jgi:hypothetical protein
MENMEKLWRSRRIRAVGWLLARGWKSDGELKRG